MYSNIVQQNISFAISLQTRLEGLEKEVNIYNDEESAKNSEIDDIKIEIQNLELKRDKELAMKETEIQKNILKLKAELEKSIKDTEIKIQELTVKRNQELSMKMDKLQENIDTLKTKLSTMAPLEVNQPPFSSSDSVKPAKIKITALAAVVGCFLALIAAFLTEFWVKNRKRVKANSTEPVKLMK